MSLLTVAFGGIAGLFLGCSLISVAEVVLYLIIGITTLPWRKLSYSDGNKKEVAKTKW